MVHARRPKEQRFDRGEKFVLSVVALAFLILFGIGWALVGIHQTQNAFHKQTSAQLKAADCVTAKCESPAIHAVISQAVAGFVEALAVNEGPDHSLICLSLAELNTTAQLESASKALATYCSGS